MDGALERLFAAVEAPATGDPNRLLYAVAPVPGQRNWFVGKDTDSRACLLLGTAQHRGARRAPIRLENFDVQFAVRCHLRRSGEADTDSVFTVIRCRSLDADTTRYFLSACEAVLRLAGSTPAPDDLATIVHRLAALFRRLERPATRHVNGLFGELYFIWRSANPAEALGAWRTDDAARFDFSVAELRVDVKTTTGRIRTHTCSYDQCNPPDGTLAVGASLFVERSAGGLTLGSLIDEIEDSVSGNADLALKLREVTAATLGTSLTDGLQTTFDIALADSSIELYDLRSVPALRDPLAQGISDVHFRSDFSLATPMDPAAALANAVFRRLAPRTFGS